MLIVTLVACEGLIPSDTTYQVQNKLGYKIYSVASYYWNGAEIKDYHSHGDLANAEITEKVLTSRRVIDIGLRKSPGGDLYITTDGFELNEGRNNILKITFSTDLYGEMVPVIRSESGKDYQMRRVDFILMPE
jgi:hypothetical protein